ncbi:helix-turn-helix transcriptional regulator [Pseudonocardia sp. DSM 110487]|uniref:helix-turn-helix domain-containing protein n=1 Tax=Pseudonocardia sp. DSM 110487 TaxID=2865833 RepID=UPI001C699961|nr:helix-turn-helix transcriptional regulator [Pseudonocardia sp. DSM 110487]QYN35491.1 helix-turn-helix transcriptional regulator [Pseudonocardia sp. DSM 110487]
MPSDNLPLNHALGALGLRLRAAREASGLTGADLAARLGRGWKQPKVSKIETGRQLISLDELRAWASETGTDPAPLLALREKAAAEYSSHQDRLSQEGGAIPLQDELTALTRTCTYLAEYQPALVPGRLQTPDYIREKALGDVDFLAEGLPADQVGHLVAAKLRRQAILYEPGREFVHIVGEAALHMRFGPMTTATLRAQLLHLAQMSSLPGHTFAVVPFRVGSPVEPFGFALYDHDLVRVETSNGVVQISDPEAVARHVRRVERLLEVASVGADAARFCRELAESMTDG